MMRELTISIFYLKLSEFPLPEYRAPTTEIFCSSQDVAFLEIESPSFLIHRLGVYLDNYIVIYQSNQ